MLWCFFCCFCSDIDECEEGNHKCGTQKCYNQPGGHQCGKPAIPLTRRRTSSTPSLPNMPTNGTLCPPGYRFNTEQDKCLDEDECLDNREICSSYEVCINSPGGYTCRCKPGFRRDEQTQACQDVNECLLENDCLPSQRCDNTIGSYNCVRFLPCGTGYTLNSATEICEDDDECAIGTHDCGPGYHCRNTVGSYRCDRDKPIRKPVTMRRPYIPPTRRFTTSTLRPTSTISSTTSTTSTTTEGTSTSSTTVSTTLKSTTALSTTTSPSTSTTVKTSTPKYVPTVGAITSTSKPSSATTSTKKPSKFPKTKCSVGFETGPNGQCVDIDECQRQPNICGRRELHRCVNSLGSYHCEAQRVLCRSGFTFNDTLRRCVDLDECVDGTHECEPDQTCQNRPGGYLCKCPMGYTVDSSQHCVDVDECTRHANFICGKNGRCVNTPGSFRCICEPGYESGAPSTGCVDVDECKQSNICQHECYNTWGSYRCGCRPGYNLRSDNRTCEDIDECVIFKDNNPCVGLCDNTPGSYRCQCPNGYVLADDGRTCEDIDECMAGDACPGAGETCYNTKGGYRCNKIKCPPGYVKDDQRKNRCKLEKFCVVGDQTCLSRPAHYTYNYIGLLSMFPIPSETGEVKLFTIHRTQNVPGSTIEFRMAFIGARSPPHVRPATESCFGLRRPYPNQVILVLLESIQGPQDIELELAMEIYHPNGDFAGTAVAKIFIIVTQWEF